MRQRQTGRVIGGAVLITVIIATVLTVTSLSAILQALRGTYDVYAVFDQATGLRIGAPVWIAGNQAGHVAAIGFRPVTSDSTPGIVVSLRIPDELRTYIRRDSDVRLTPARLVGDPVVDITPGSAMAPILDPGDTLYGRPRVTQAALMRSATAFAGSIDSLMTDVAALDAPLERSTKRFAILDERIAAASGHLRTLRSNIEAGRSFDPDVIMARVRQLGATMQRVQEQLAAAEARAEQTGAKAALQNATRRAAQVRQQAEDVRQMLERGSFARMQNDSAIQVALRRAQAQLDSLMVETKRNPLRFWLGNSGKDEGY